MKRLSSLAWFLPGNRLSDSSMRWKYPLIVLFRLSRRLGYSYPPEAFFSPSTMRDSLMKESSLPFDDPLSRDMISRMSALRTHSPTVCKVCSFIEL